MTNQQMAPLNKYLDNDKNFDSGKNRSIYGSH